MKQYGIIVETTFYLTLKFTIKENSLGAAIAKGRIETLKAAEDSGLVTHPTDAVIKHMAVVEIFNEATSVFS
jgi:hypothetical protein